MKNAIYLMLLATGLLIASCNSTQKKVNIASSEVMKVDTLQGSCPFLTTDNHGNVVLSWIKKINPSSYIYCYAVSKDGGKTFGNTIGIPGTGNIHPHGENMPKIIFKPNGAIIAAWPEANPNAMNEYSDRVFYATSSDNGSTWSQPQKLVNDNSGYDQRYFDMALLPNGEAAIIWLDNRKASPIPWTKEGSALYIAKSNGNSGFEDEHLVSEPCCPCCRIGLLVDSKKNIHIVYRSILRGNIRDMVHSVSMDNGKAFSTPERISEDNWVINGCPHTGPSMTENKNGIQFAWFTGGAQGGVFYCQTNNDGKSFSPREEVSGMNSRHAQITSLPSGELAIVWDTNTSHGAVSASRIGIEIRNADGTQPVKKYITAETGSATFPVIENIDKNTMLVAYTEYVKNKEYVRYKLVRL